MIKSNRILIIDDSVELITEMKKILGESDKTFSLIDDKLFSQFAGEEEENKKNKKISYDLTVSNSGEEGYELVKKSLQDNIPFALVFIDLLMPKWDGVKTAKEIKKIDKNIEMVIITATGSFRRREILTEIGSPEKIIFLKKPFSEEEVKQLALSMVSKWNIEQAEKEKTRYLENSIAEIKTLQESLSINEKRLKQIINLMPDMIYVKNSEGRILMVNHQFEKITNSSDNDLNNKFHKSIFSKNEEFEKIIEYDHEVLEKGKKIEIPEMEYTDYNNIVHILNVIKIPFVTTDTTEKAILTIATDISEKKKIEKQLIQAQKMETIGNLAGGLAHDFNNILSGITGTASIIKYSLDEYGPMKDELSEHISVLEEASERAINIVRQLLLISKKQNEIDSRSSINLNEIIKNVYDICKNSFNKKIELNFNYSLEQAITYADHTQIEQILLNICINASHAMTIMRNDNENQGGLLTVSIDKCLPGVELKEKLHINNDNEYWKLTITDTGVGIEEKYLTKIFEPFFSTKFDEKSTGLGLSMVFNIMKKHHGFINLNSEYGKGTSFFLYLPVSKKEKIQKNKQNSKIYQGDGHILVIDDESIMRKIVQSMLATCGYKVLLAEDGEIGIEIFKKNKNIIKAVILDLSMPKKSGIETFTEIQRINPEIKVIIYTGFVDSMTKEMLMKHGIKGILNKPFNLEEISKKLNVILKDEK